MSCQVPKNSSCASALSQRYAERRALRAEEKTTRQMIIKIQEQMTQLEVEKLELKARAALEGQDAEFGASPRKRQKMEVDDVKNGVIPDKQEEEELHLAINPIAVLEKIHQGRFATEVEEDEEEEEEEEIHCNT